MMWCWAIALLALFPALAADNTKPPLPPTTVPDLRTTDAAIMSVESDAPFDGATHKLVLDGLVNNTYFAELRNALYLQDSAYQFSSKAHFDNCDFDASIAYLEQLLAEAGKHVDTALTSRKSKDEPGAIAAAKKAFFALGRALHGVQDFYAHTNYVELAKADVKRVTDIAVVAPWRDKGKALIQELLPKGLVSGYVFWGFPQRCPGGALSHGALANDSESTTAGKIKVPHLNNITQYKIAVTLAREASRELMRDAFERWPILSELNGPNIALEAFVDRRGLK